MDLAKRGADQLSVVEMVTYKSRIAFFVDTLPEVNKIRMKECIVF